MMKPAYFVILLLCLVRPCLADNVVITDISIRGNSHTAAQTILHYCNFKVGDELPEQELARKMEKSRQKLLNTRYFYSVSVFSMPAVEPRMIVITIEVTEGFLWRFGGGPVYARIGKENLWGKAKSLEVQAGVNIQSLKFDDRWLGRTPVFWGIWGCHKTGLEYSVEDESTTDESFTVESMEGRVRWGYHLGTDGEALLNLAAEKAVFSRKEITVTSEKGLGIDADKNIITISPQITWDARNRPDYPSSGCCFDLSGEISRNSIGSDFNYQKARFESRGYISPRLGQTVAARLVFGTGGGDIPYYRLFDIHGIDGLRAPGYLHYAGQCMTLATIEYRCKLFTLSLLGIGEWAEGVIFTDIGRTWDKGEPIIFSNIDYALGPGLRVHFPMPVFADIRLEYGWGKAGSKLFFHVKESF